MLQNFVFYMLATHFYQKFLIISLFTTIFTIIYYYLLFLQLFYNYFSFYIEVKLPTLQYLPFLIGCFFFQFLKFLFMQIVFTLYILQIVNILSSVYTILKLEPNLESMQYQLIKSLVNGNLHFQVHIYRLVVEHFHSRLSVNDCFICSESCVLWEIIILSHTLLKMKFE